MIDYAKKIEEALIRGEWTIVSATAEAWACAVGLNRDPRPYFALNVVQLIRGEYGAAWQTHARALQEPADIEVVKNWVDCLLKEQPDQARIHFVAGLFLAQSGQSEDSVARYKERFGSIRARHSRITSSRKFMSEPIVWIWPSRNIGKR
jgi:hypothetical protein